MGHGYMGLLKKAPYVSPSGYVVMFCLLPTQGVALGCAMKPLRGNGQETDIGPMGRLQRGRGRLQEGREYTAKRP